jgi:hypothetical protein
MQTMTDLTPDATKTLQKHEVNAWRITQMHKSTNSKPDAPTNSKVTNSTPHAPEIKQNKNEFDG